MKDPEVCLNVGRNGEMAVQWKPKFLGRLSIGVKGRTQIEEV